MHYFSPLNTFMRKGKDPDPDPYRTVPLTNGSGSPTLPFTQVCACAVFVEREDDDSPVIGELMLRGRGITLK
jgi:hypothetical protein